MGPQEPPARQPRRQSTQLRDDPHTADGNSYERWSYTPARRSWTQAHAAQAASSSPFRRCLRC